MNGKDISSDKRARLVKEIHRLEYLHERGLLHWLERNRLHEKRRELAELEYERIHGVR